MLNLLYNSIKGDQAGNKKDFMQINLRYLYFLLYLYKIILNYRKFIYYMKTQMFS
jgi:hypothetical protein